MAYVIDMVLDRAQQAKLFEIGDHPLARNITIETGVCAAFGAAFDPDVAGIVHDVDGRQIVALAQGKVVGIVRGRDLDSAGAKLARDPLVQHNWNLAAHQW